MTCVTAEKFFTASSDSIVRLCNDRNYAVANFWDFWDTYLDSAEEQLRAKGLWLRNRHWLGGPTQRELLVPNPHWVKGTDGRYSVVTEQSLIAELTKLDASALRPIARLYNNRTKYRLGGMTLISESYFEDSGFTGGYWRIRRTVNHGQLHRSLISLSHLLGDYGFEEIEPTSPVEMYTASLP